MVFHDAISSVTINGVEPIRNVPQPLFNKVALIQAQAGASASISSQMTTENISFSVVHQTIHLNNDAREAQAELVKASHAKCLKIAKNLSSALRAHGAAEGNRAVLEHPVFQLGNVIRGDAPQQDTSNMIRHADLLPAVNAQIRSFNACSDSFSKP
jgi:hypothetical protein